MAIDMSRSYNNSDNTILTVAAVLAFIPFFGLFGIHDFIVRNHKNGGMHLMLVALGYAILWLANSSFDHHDYSINFIISVVSTCIILVSYIWAIIEGVRFLRLRKSNIKLQQTTALSAPPQTVEAINGNINLGSVQTMNTKEVYQYKMQNKKTKSNAWAILSIVTAVVPVLLWTYCLFVSGGSTSENGPGAAWWLVIIYYWGIGIPLAIISIAFGVVGLKTNLRWLSIASLLIKAATVITILLFLIVCILNS